MVCSTWNAWHCRYPFADSLTDCKIMPWKFQDWEGYRRIKSSKKAGFNADALRKIKSEIDSEYILITACSSTVINDLETKVQHMLITATNSLVLAFLARWCRDSKRLIVFVGSDKGTDSLDFPKRDRSIPFVLSESCFSSVLAVEMSSTSGSTKRRASGFDGCFLR